MAEQPFHMFQHQQQSYPEPPQHAFTSPPMDMGLTADAAFGAGFPRSGQDAYPAATPMGFEASLYADTPNYILNGRASPGSYHDDSDMRLPSSSLSSASAPSAPSSAIGSPQSNHGQLGGVADWNAQGMAVQPSIVGNDYMSGAEYFPGAGIEDLGAFDFGAAQTKTFVDPSLIHPEIARPPMAISPYDGHFQQPPNPFVPSPSVSSSPQPNLLRTNSSSPYLHNGPFQAAYAGSPYGAPMDTGRRVSMPGSFISPGSAEYHSSDETKEKQRCTYPDCGKVFKDLKAHMLTHQNERPEKCPIQTCEYHVKGFARKYDKNRHTLTHYKGTMVCGFCPGSGSPAEKSFNRADVFKRHLTAVHGVEQTPPNSRKKTPTGVSAGKKLTGYAPDATGKCSTCSQTFSNAQDFYEHLDDCVLRIVQQEDPAEAINAQRLAEVENDKSVHQTLEKNNLPTTTQTSQLVPLGEEEGESPNGVQKSRGMTHSRGGVPLATKARGRKNRRDYPSSWGFDKGQMNMKKRIMAVFDGPRRLAKDDMMLSTDHEVRIKLSDGKSYVTDLDVQTLKRAEGFLGATDDEKGPWISDDPTEEQLKEMKEMLETNTASI
ncbi:hypothetical protein ACCO45_010737 [Purpureocillium lilacinum]|uniref:Uncharacterized protein n=1 Tax=Purpureocillium lilacinum TaxID=33203 RepID=A0ACC4DFV9_PURLI